MTPHQFASGVNIQKTNPIHPLIKFYLFYSALFTMKVSLSFTLLAVAIMSATAFVGMSDKQILGPTSPTTSSSQFASPEQLPDLLLAATSAESRPVATAFLEKVKASSGSDFTLDLSAVDMTAFKEYGPWALTTFASLAAMGQRQAGYDQATEEIMEQIVSGELDVEEVSLF